MQNDKIRALQESIKLQEGIMIETQNQIRQAENILISSKKQYQRAMEEKINLQDKLIAEINKHSAKIFEVEKQMNLMQETRSLEIGDKKK